MHISKHEERIEIFCYLPAWLVASKWLKQECWNDLHKIETKQTHLSSKFVTCWKFIVFVFFLYLKPFLSNKRNHCNNGNTDLVQSQLKLAGIYLFKIIHRNIMTTCDLFKVNNKDTRSTSEQCCWCQCLYC